MELKTEKQPVFVNAAREAVKSLDQSAFRASLEYLLKHALGHENAKPIELVVDHVEKRGYKMTVQQFQQTIMKSTRIGNIFIGSCSRGVFLIKDAFDVLVMQEFYTVRIASEVQHLHHLMTLAKQIR